MKKYLIHTATLLALSWLLMAFSVHKYYISFTKIDYVEKSSSLQIIMQVFTDDLQNGLDTQFSIKSELDTDRELAESDTYVEDYIKDKFFIYVNKQKMPLQYLGKKYDKDETKLYIEIEQIETIERIEVKNRMLMELFEDQQNIIKLKIKGKKKSFILTEKDDKDLLKF